MKKLLKVTALSATAFSLLGTVPVSAADGAGQTTVTYDPGYVSPSGATWGISFTKTVSLNSTHEVSGVNASEINDKGEDITFTVVDAGTSNHTTNDNVKVTLVDVTESNGEIKMEITGTDSGTAEAPKMALATTDSSSKLIINDSSAGTGDIATLVNTESGNQYTTTIKAAITDAGEMSSASVAGKSLTFKFTQTI